MGDLEDVLKKNVPGRYSSWVEENDDDKQRNDHDKNNSDDVSDSEDDEYYFEGLPTDNSRTSSSSNMQQQEEQSQQQLRPSGNTGVKGVLADYREAKQREQLIKEKERLDKLEALYQATHPAMRRAEDCNIISTNNSNNNDTNDCDDNDSYDEDDDFLKQFRNQRLSELKQQQQQQQQRSTTSLPPKALFGSLTTVTPEEYVKLVDNMNNINTDYYLIVHLYESSIQQCQILHSTLDKLASSSWMEHVQFIEVNALEANSNLDTICLPAILIYKRGELIHNVVRFTDDLSEGYDVEDVKKVLEKLVPFRG